jgi:hypothetical protein
VAAPVNATDAATKTYVDATARSLASLTMNISAYAARQGSGTTGDVATGCVGFSGNGQVQLDLPLPFGAVISSVTVKYMDTSTASFTMDVRTYSFQEGVSRSDNSAGLHSSTNGTGNGERVQTIATPGAAA